MTQREAAVHQKASKVLGIASVLIFAALSGVVAFGLARGEQDAEEERPSQTEDETIATPPSGASLSDRDGVGVIGIRIEQPTVTCTDGVADVTVRAVSIDPLPVGSVVVTAPVQRTSGTEFKPLDAGREVTPEMQMVSTAGSASDETISIVTARVPEIVSTSNAEQFYILIRATRGGLLQSNTLLLNTTEVTC